MSVLAYSGDPAHDNPEDPESPFLCMADFCNWLNDGAYGQETVDPYFLQHVAWRLAEGVGGPCRPDELLCLALKDEDTGIRLLALDALKARYLGRQK